MTANPLTDETHDAAVFPMHGLEHTVHVNSLFVASYTARLGGAFYGYSRIFLRRPDDVWADEPFAKIGTAFGYAVEQHALDEAEWRAVKVIERLVLSRPGARSRRVFQPCIAH